MCHSACEPVPGVVIGVVDEGSLFPVLVFLQEGGRLEGIYQPDHVQEQLHTLGDCEGNEILGSLQKLLEPVEGRDLLYESYHTIPNALALVAWVQHVEDVLHEWHSLNHFVDEAAPRNGTTREDSLQGWYWS